MANPVKIIKGIQKATKLPGGKKGRAIENKARKELGMRPGETAGMYRADLQSFRHSNEVVQIFEKTKKISGSNKNLMKQINNLKKQQQKNVAKNKALTPKVPVKKKGK